MDEILLTGINDTAEKPEFLLATVSALSNDGIQLIFDGQTEPSQKYYKRVANLSPPGTGNRVVVMKHSGTYIVLGEITSDPWTYHYSTSISNIISAGSGFTITSASYYRYGIVVQLYVKASATSGSSSNSWKTVGTVKSGRRPVANVLMKELNNRLTCLYSGGNLNIYGTYSSGQDFEFSATYLAP